MFEDDIILAQHRYIARLEDVLDLVQQQLTDVSYVPVRVDYQRTLREELLVESETLLDRLNVKSYEVLRAVLSHEYTHNRLHELYVR